MIRKRRNSNAGRTSRGNKAEMVMFSSRVDASLDEYVRLHVETKKTTKQDVLRKALLLFKQNEERSDLTISSNP